MQSISKMASSLAEDGPQTTSSGGKQTLLGISKRGDCYLRTLLIHGARALLRVAERKAEFATSWLAGVIKRRNHIRWLQ